MKRLFLPFFVLPALVVAACNTLPTDLPTESASAVSAGRMFALNTPTGEPVGSVTAVFPSTNALNLDNGWAHVLLVDAAVGQVTLNFVQPRAFWACFEYRIDDEAPTLPGSNYNTDITDGMWLYTCRNNSSLQKTFTATHHVDIRMGFGAESDERFDWTRFYVVSLSTVDQCKNGGWEAFGFKNQGQCVRYIETGKDSRVGG